MKYHLTYYDMPSTNCGPTTGEIRVIYLLQVEKDVGTNIYKVGRTRCPKTRFYAYKQPGMKCFSTCEDEVAMEREIINIFKRKFGKPVRGREYFKGDLDEMKKIIGDAIYSKSKCAKENLTSVGYTSSFTESSDTSSENTTSKNIKKKKVAKKSKIKANCSTTEVLEKNNRNTKSKIESIYVRDNESGGTYKTDEESEPEEYIFSMLEVIDYDDWCSKNCVVEDKSDTLGISSSGCSGTPYSDNNDGDFRITTDGENYCGNRLADAVYTISTAAIDNSRTNQDIILNNSANSANSNVGSTKSKTKLSEYVDHNIDSNDSDDDSSDNTIDSENSYDSESDIDLNYHQDASKSTNSDDTISSLYDLNGNIRDIDDGKKIYELCKLYYKNRFK